MPVAPNLQSVCVGCGGPPYESVRDMKPREAGPGEASRGAAPWRYAAGFLAQAIGAALMLATILPRYQALIRDASQLTEEPWRLAVSLGWIVLMQLGYWSSRALTPPAPRIGRPVAGQVIRFAGRLVFMFVTSLFSFLFITRTHRVELPPRFAVVAVLGLFSLYCFTDHVERLGSAVASGRSAGARE